jgi:hypothetical protein
VVLVFPYVEPLSLFLWRMIMNQSSCFRDSFSMMMFRLDDDGIFNALWSTV